MKTRIGIFGYGNLGRGVENAIKQNEDMTLVAVATVKKICDGLEITMAQFFTSEIFDNLEQEIK